MFLVVCLALSSKLVFSQSLVTLGANYSTLKYPIDSPYGKLSWENYKFTPSFGYGYNIKIGEKWSYQPGLTLGDLGGLDYPNDYYILVASVNQFFDYRLVPKLSVGFSPSIYYVGFAGVQGGKWRKYEEEIHRLVLTIIPRITFHLNEKWGVDLFYRKDLTSVGNPDFTLFTYRFKYKGHGTGINLKYQLQPKKSSQRNTI